MPKRTPHSSAPPLARSAALHKVEPTLQATGHHLEKQRVIGLHREMATKSKMQPDKYLPGLLESFVCSRNLCWVFPDTTNGNIDKQGTIPALKKLADRQGSCHNTGRGAWQRLAQVLRTQRREQQVMPDGVFKSWDSGRGPQTPQHPC